MAQGYKDFTAGAVLAAADLEDYNQNQSIMRFASAAARDTALSVVKTEGMCAYLIDVNTVTVYTGSAWSTIGPVHGALTAVTPTITQSGAVTKTVNYSAYSRIGRLIIGNALLTMTGAGTASNAITITGLPACATGTDNVGTGYITDASGPIQYFVTPYFLNTTTLQFHGTVHAGGAALTAYILGVGANTMTAALASGDVISFTYAYEAGADA